MAWGGTHLMSHCMFFGDRLVPLKLSDDVILTPGLQHVHAASANALPRQPLQLREPLVLLGTLIVVLWPLVTNKIENHL